MNSPMKELTTAFDIPVVGHWFEGAVGGGGCNRKVAYLRWFEPKTQTSDASC